MLPVAVVELAGSSTPDAEGAAVELAAPSLGTLFTGPEVEVPAEVDPGGNIDPSGFVLTALGMAVALLVAAALLAEGNAACDGEEVGEALVLSDDAESDGVESSALFCAPLHAPSRACPVSNKTHWVSGRTYKDEESRIMVGTGR